MALDRGKLLARFLQEAREHCAVINRGLLSLEQNPGHRGVLDEICRSAHTVKGASRMMKLGAVTAVAHGMEDVFDALKNGRIEFSPTITSLLFRAVDAVGGMLERIAGGENSPASDDELCQKLQGAAAGELSRAFPADDALKSVPGNGDALKNDAVKKKGKMAPRSGGEGDLQVPKPISGDTIRVAIDKLDGLIKLMGELSSARSRQQGSLPCLREAIVLSGTLLDRHADETDQDPDRHASYFTTVTRLHGILTQVYSSLKEEMLSQESLTRELLQGSLAMRTLPLSTIFDTFPRTVRDLSCSLGKEIEFTVEGGETELDKMIVEKIGDPLIHMVRNAIDHGIESRDERLRAGKRGTGTIRLSAWYDGNSVTVLVRDDGRGISLDKVRAKALQKNIVDEESLAAMSEAELMELLFLPGFSTSDIVTEFSGRGVGLDVVRKNIVDDLKGSIRIDSREGTGTTLSLKLPLNLALFRLLFVSAADRQFAFLADAVEEVVSVSPEELIAVVNKNAVRLRNEVIPVEGLAALLNLAESRTDQGQKQLIAIVTSGNEKLGLVIDAVLDEEGVVVKPLPSHLKKIRIVSGATVRGKSLVVPLLSVPVLSAAARERKAVHPEMPAVEHRKDRTVLVVDDSISTREIEKNIIEA
ncbi:MAG TPA: chemotaxis protein CheA, partial [Geobacteraceae bacterium]|nr:chemotaxis protein CheA [Geobacteraceae bacterium]